jgi:hypothetical protein
MILNWSDSLKGQCADSQSVFVPGERVEYEVAYNWGILWVDAGYVHFQVDTLRRDGELHYSFESRGQSFRFYDWFFKVRDRFSAVVKADGYLPVWFERDTYEGGYKVLNQYTYLWNEGLVISETENSNKPYSVDTLPLEPCTFDVLSAVYFARSLDVTGLDTGDSIPLRFLIDGAFYDLYIRYLGQETIQNRDRKMYHCNVFSAQLVEGTIFSGGENMLVWVTSDIRKIPVLIEARIRVGSVKAYLTGFQ